MVGEGELGNLHELPNLLGRLARVWTGVNIFAEERERAELAAHLEEALVLHELAEQLFRREDIVAFGEKRVRIDFLREERFRLPLDQRGRHQEEVGRDVEVQLLH